MTSEEYRQHVIIPIEEYIHKIRKKYDKTKNPEIKNLMEKAEDLQIHCFEIYSNLLSHPKQKEK